MAEDNLDEDLDLGIEQTGSSKKKLIIIGAAVLAVLIIGGVVAWFLLGDGGEEVAEGEEAVEVEVVAPAIYHPLNPVFVVNLPPGGKVKMLQVAVQVMARNAETIKFIQHNDPMIRHTLLSLFGSQDGNKLRDSKGKAKLQSDVLSAINKIVKEQAGPGEVEAIFFTSFVMQ